MQRSAGNQQVMRLLTRTRGSIGGRSNTEAALHRDTSPRLAQRQGPYELDFGKPRPPNPAQRKLDQDRRLRGIQSWLAENRTRMAWLGLFDQGETSNGQLAESVEWLTMHVSSWIELEDTLPDDLWQHINTVYQEASTWLGSKSTDRWKNIDALIAEAHNLHLDRVAQVVEADKRAVDQQVSGSTPLWRQVNAKMRSLDERAATWPPMLKQLATAIGAYNKISGVVEAAFEQFDTSIERYPTLFKRNQHISDLGTLRNNFEPRVTTLERTHTKLLGPTATINIEALDSLSKAYSGAANFLKEFDKKQVAALGERIEEAESRQTGTSSGSTASLLPRLPQAQAGALPTAEMLIPAVRESRKSPEWKQVAIDFTLGLLATGRPDHIHICGGGNTLVYNGRLILGYMTEHLDSRQVSKRQFNKIIARSWSTKIRVVVHNGELKQVV